MCVVKYLLSFSAKVHGRATYETARFQAVSSVQEAAETFEEMKKICPSESETFKRQEEENSFHKP